MNYQVSISSARAGGFLARADAVLRRGGARAITFGAGYELRLDADATAALELQQPAGRRIARVWPGHSVRWRIDSEAEQPLCVSDARALAALALAQTAAGLMVSENCTEEFAGRRNYLSRHARRLLEKSFLAADALAHARALRWQVFDLTTVCAFN